jgi:SAM-dependent methyltransferase
VKRAKKQRLLAIARAAGLLPLLDRVRYLRSKRASAEENRAFLENNAEFSPPPLWWMHDMYRHTSFDQYWRTGRETSALIAAKIDTHLDAARPRIADWGCGLGRVVRHLPDRYERTGFDYNFQAIAWDTDHISGVRFLKNDLSPPLPADDACFDAVYALSVFTHLSAGGHKRWIDEIERVLAPGGVFLGAFHVRPPAGQLLPAEQARFDAGELVVRGGVKEGSRIFTAHHPEAYLRDTLFQNFDIVEGPTELLSQTLFVVRKR